MDHTGSDLSVAALRRATFKRARFLGVDISEANLHGQNGQASGDFPSRPRRFPAPPTRARQRGPAFGARVCNRRNWPSNQTAADGVDLASPGGFEPPLPP
ncbi:MAG: pentapeptide repeat-containing protein [Bryobacteraceae bacterium]